MLLDREKGSLFTSGTCEDTGSVVLAPMSK